MSAAEELPRFKSISDMLAYAYAMQAKEVRPKGMGELVSKGTNPAELTLYDKLTEGVLLVKQAQHCLRGKVMLQCAVNAYYTIPRDRDLAARKDDAVFRLARYLHSRRHSIPDRWFVYDVVDGWAHHCGGPRAHDLNWWAGRMKKTYSRVHEWAMRNDEKRVGIVPALKHWLSQAEEEVESGMQQEGAFHG